MPLLHEPRLLCQRLVGRDRHGNCGDACLVADRMELVDVPHDGLRRRDGQVIRATHDENQSERTSLSKKSSQALSHLRSLALNNCLVHFSGHPLRSEPHKTAHDHLRGDVVSESLRQRFTVWREAVARGSKSGCETVAIGQDPQRDTGREPLRRIQPEIGHS